MLTLRQMCGEAITRLFPFTISHVPTLTKESFGWVFQILNNNGFNPLNIIPLNVTVRALQCTYADRIHYFKWMGNTDYLDLSNSELPNYELSSLYSTLQMMYSGIYPKDNPLRVLRLPKAITLDLDYLEKILRLCCNIKILGISDCPARLGETHYYTLLRLLELSPHLSLELRSLAFTMGIETRNLMRTMSPFKERFSLIAPWVDGVDEDLQEISLNSQLIGLNLQRDVTNGNELLALQQVFEGHRRLNIKFSISVRGLGDFKKLLTLMFPPIPENKAFVWNECQISRIWIGVQDIEQEELNLLLSLQVKELQIERAKKITQIHSQTLNNLICKNMSALKSVYLPYAEGNLTVFDCNQLMDIHAPKAYSIHANTCPVIEKIHGEGAEMGKISYCPELKEAVFPIASTSVMINECNKLETFYAPSVKELYLFGVHCVTTLNLHHATEVNVADCKGLVRARLTKAEDLSIYSCPLLKHLDAPNAHTASKGQGNRLTSLKTLKIPSFTAAVDLRLFPHLTALDARNASMIYVEGQRNHQVSIRSPKWSWPKNPTQGCMILGLFVQVILGFVFLHQIYMGKTKNSAEGFQISIIVVASLTAAVANTCFIKNTVIPEITRIKRL